MSEAFQIRVRTPTQNADTPTRNYIQMSPIPASDAFGCPYCGVAYCGAAAAGDAQLCTPKFCCNICCIGCCCCC